MRFLYHAVHYPKPEHRDDLLRAMRRLDDAFKDTPGLLDIGVWRDELSRGIVALSFWESRERFEAAAGRFVAAIADVPFDEWEERPAELLELQQVTLPD